MMNLAASLYGRVNVKELLRNAPVYSGATGNHFYFPSLMFASPFCILGVSA